MISGSYFGQFLFTPSTGSHTKGHTLSRQQEVCKLTISVDHSSIPQPPWMSPVNVCDQGYSLTTIM